MYYRAEQILSAYPKEFTGNMKGRGSILCADSEGIYLLKEYTGSVHRLELLDLRSQIRNYTEMYERDTRYLKEIEANPEALSKIARERYYMKADNEDVFVLESDTHE